MDKSSGKSSGKSSDLFSQINNKSNNIYESGTFVFFVIIITTIVLIINLNAIMWIQKLEKINCACSEHWMRKYIEYYLYAIIPIQFINIFIYLYLYSTNNMKLFNSNNTALNMYLSFVKFVGFFGAINIFIVIIFINKLKEINCYCSEDIKRDVYYIYNIVQLSIISMYLFFAILGTGLFIYNYKN